MYMLTTVVLVTSNVMPFIVVVLFFPTCQHGLSYILFFSANRHYHILSSSITVISLTLSFQFLFVFTHILLYADLLLSLCRFRDVFTTQKLNPRVVAMYNPYPMVYSLSIPYPTYAALTKYGHLDVSSLCRSPSFSSIFSLCLLPSFFRAYILRHLSNCRCYIVSRLVYGDITA